jgi:SAM-dependent methyltransferase
MIAESAALDRATAMLDAEARWLLGLPPATPLELLPEPGRSYLDYALKTLRRGREAIASVATHGSLAGVRYLDVGSAWGGFLAAAAEAGAREVVGLEVDARLVGVCRRYLAARGTTARLQLGDATAAATMAELGKFDVITCSDVVEHVHDVPGLLANLAGALAPGGRVHLAIPNRCSPFWMRSDPHFLRFGIVLLTRPHAQRYARLAGFEGYDVGDYFRFGQYRYWLERHGLDVEVANVPPRSPSVRERLDDEMREIREVALSWSDPALPGDLVRKVRAAVLAVTAAYRRDARTADDDDARWRLLRRYAVPVWEVVARRPQRRPPLLVRHARALARRLHEVVRR